MDKTVKELRKEATKRKIKGRSKLNRLGLLKALGYKVTRAAGGAGGGAWRVRRKSPNKKSVKRKSKKRQSKKRSLKKDR